MIDKEYKHKLTGEKLIVKKLYGNIAMCKGEKSQISKRLSNDMYAVNVYNLIEV